MDRIQIGSHSLTVPMIPEAYTNSKYATSFHERANEFRRVNVAHLWRLSRAAPTTIS